MRCSSSARRRALLAASALLVLGGCRVTTGVDVRVDAGGAGHVTVEVALDRDAAARAGDLSLRVADLRRAEWTVRGPLKRADGGVAVTARRDFRSVEEATAILGDLGEPFRDVRVTRSRSFARTHTDFTGTLDLSRGLESFSDARLATQLGGRPLGVEPDRLEEANEGLSMRVRARLAGGSASWQARTGDRTSMRASAEAWNVVNLLLAVLSAGCAVAAGVAARRRVRGRHRDERLRAEP